MPKISKPEFASHAEAIAMARIADFEQPSEWRRNNKLSLSRDWGIYRVSVFWKRGRFCWSIRDNEDGTVRYSPDCFATEAEALENLSIEMCF